MPSSALQSFNTTTVSSKVPVHAGSRACDAQRPATSARVHRAQDRETPASTHRVRSTKELGSWEGASALLLKSPVSDTRASKVASFGYACEDENLLSLLRSLHHRSSHRPDFDSPVGVKAAPHTEAWAGGISVRYFYVDKSMADEAGPPASPLAASSSPFNIDISTPAVVEWGSTDTLSEVTFDARRLDSTNDAFFKLRSTVTLKAAASAKTPFFIFIHAERIRLLQVVEVAAAEPGQACRVEEARKRLGSHTVCLRFVLTRPADLVGPKGVNLTPKNRASGALLDSLRTLACRNTFAIHFPRNVVSQARLASLCEAANNGTLTSTARQADLTSLYKGKGGQVISEAEPVVGASIEPNSPPSYDELGPGPPPAPFDEPEGPSKKRRRRSSDVTSARIDPLDVERMCRKIVDEQKAEMLKSIQEQQRKLYSQLIADLKPYISQEMQKLEHRLLDHIERCSGKQAEEQGALLEQRLEEVQDEINDTIESRVHDVDEKVEEEFYGLRGRLEEFIEEEMTHAEERMVEHLQNSASISLQFNP